MLADPTARHSSRARRSSFTRPPGAVLKAVGALKRKRNLAILPTLPNACHFDV